MKIVLTIILSISSFALNAQPVPVNFNDCEYEMFFAIADQPPEWNKPEQNIYDYLNERLNDYTIFRNAQGKIALGILIYENGKPCCHSFTNMTDWELEPEIFKNIVNDMPEWKPGKHQQKPIVFLYHILFTVRNGKVEKYR